MARCVTFFGFASFALALCMSACGAQSTPLEIWPDSGTRPDVSTNTGHDQGSGGMGGAPQVPSSEPSSCAPGDFLVYTQPGCGADVKRTCLTGAAGACATEACSCNGESIGGTCNGGFYERFTRDRSCLDRPVVPPPIPRDEDAGAVSSDLDGGSSESQCQIDSDCVLVPKGCCACQITAEDAISVPKAQARSVELQQCPQQPMCAACPNLPPTDQSLAATCYRHQCAVVITQP